MRINAVVIPGHGVASSGKVKDPRYPSGTIQAQFECFRERGLDLSAYFSGTVNVDIAPHSFRIKKPTYFFENVDWSEHIPPENFYFFDVSLQLDEKTYDGLIYLPDPTTKEEHFQQPTTLELLLPKIDGLAYGDAVIVDIKEDQLAVS